MFTFKLQQALNYRKVLEEKKMVEFSEGKKALEQEREILAMIHLEQERMRRELKEMQGTALQASDAALYLTSLEFFKQKEVRQQEIIEKAGQEVEKRRLALLEAVKNRKVMDTLKDRQFREHEATMASRERKSLDETAISRFIRNRK